MSLALWFAAASAFGTEPEPTHTVAVDADRRVFDARGHIAWRPGVPVVRHADGRVAWTRASGACFDPSGQRQVGEVCVVDLGAGRLLHITAVDGSPEPTLLEVQPNLLALTPVPAVSE